MNSNFKHITISVDTKKLMDKTMCSIGIKMSYNELVRYLINSLDTKIKLTNGNTNTNTNTNGNTTHKEEI